MPGHDEQDGLGKHNGPKQAIAGRVASCSAYRSAAIEVRDARGQVTVLNTDPVRQIDANNWRDSGRYWEPANNHPRSITDAYLLYVWKTRKGLI